MPARLQVVLMRTTSSKVLTSLGNGPKRSISSAANPSISTLVISSDRRR